MALALARIYICSLHSHFFFLSPFFLFHMSLRTFISVTGHQAWRDVFYDLLSRYRSGWPPTDTSSFAQIVECHTEDGCWAQSGMRKLLYSHEPKNRCCMSISFSKLFILPILIKFQLFFWPDAIWGTPLVIWFWCQQNLTHEALWILWDLVLFWVLHQIVLLFALRFWGTLREVWRLSPD